MFYGSLTGFGGGSDAPPTNFFEDIQAAGLDTNCILCLDAGAADSYTSGQKWLDLSSQGFDFHLGASASAASDDPTFNGVAGDLASSNYFSFDGGDRFKFDATTDALFDDLHQNNAECAVMAWVYKDDIADQVGILDTLSTSGERGFNFRIQSDTYLSLTVNSGVGPTPQEKAVDDATSADAWHLVGISIDEATGSGGMFFYEDGAYKQDASSNTQDATYLGSPYTGAATGVGIGARGVNAAVPSSAGVRMAGIMIWSGVVITKANMDTLWDAQRERFGV